VYVIFPFLMFTTSSGIFESNMNAPSLCTIMSLVSGYITLH
jgi:hypothetical protein